MVHTLMNRKFGSYYSFMRSIDTVLVLSKLSNIDRVLL
jgi:hypothetical protein